MSNCLRSCSSLSPPKATSSQPRRLTWTAERVTLTKCRCHQRGTCDMTQMLCQAVLLHMTRSVNRNCPVWCRSSLCGAVSHKARSRWWNGRVGEQTMFVWRCNNYLSLFLCFFSLSFPPSLPPSLPTAPLPLQTDCCSTLCTLFKGCRLANNKMPSHLYP